MFSVGDLVVCIDDGFCAAASEFCLQVPRKGSIYTVRKVVARLSCGGRQVRTGLLLAEIQLDRHEHRYRRIQGCLPTQDRR